MKKDLGRHDEVHMMLRRLEQYSTLSPFCKLFYRVIYDRLGEPGLDSHKLDQAFHLFLRCECWRHQAVSHIVRQGKLDLIEIMRVGRDAYKNLARICSAVEKMEPAGPREAMIRELILVECSYHLGRTEEVIRGLRRTLRLGCDHPLVHFALGYNIYRSALARFARTGRRKGEIVTDNPRAFENACRQAIAAFECGLGDRKFDAQICWWIGLISEMIGDRHAAGDAYLRAMNIDPDNFGGMGDEKLRKLNLCALIMRSPAERERLAGLAPITDHDIHEARKSLAELDSFPTFFLDSP